MCFLHKKIYMRTIPIQTIYKVSIMKLKRKLEMNRHKVMLHDLEQMYEKGEISEQTYEEMKEKYEDKVQKMEDELEEAEDEIEIELEGLGEEIEGLGEEMGELGMRISEKVNDAVSKAMKRVNLTVANLPDSYQFETGEHYTEEEVFEGSFDSDSVFIDFRTLNGNIELNKWDEDTYKIVAVKRVRSYSEEKARKKLSKVKLNFQHIQKGTPPSSESDETVSYAEDQGREVLRLDPEEHRASVSIIAYLPATAKGGILSRDRPIHYDTNLESVNGRISVKGIHMGKAEMDATNGRMNIEQVHARDLNVDAMNGKITLEDCEIEKGVVSSNNGKLTFANVRGKTFTGSTDNGPIRGNISFEHAELKTDNGSIRVELKERGEYELTTDVGSISLDVSRDIPYHIDAASGMGKVRVSSDLEVATMEKRRAIIESSNYTGAEERLYVKARTDLGSIRIN